jgi:hypothetical protein
MPVSAPLHHREAVTPVAAPDSEQKAARISFEQKFVATH